MKFRTEIEPLPHHGAIDYQSDMVSIGSCFAENIGDRLLNHQFKIKVNPFGILFNPISILNILNNAQLNENHLVKVSSGMVSYDFHSKFRAGSESEFKQQHAEAQSTFSKSIQSANILMITFGTAWVYRLKSTNKIVANCQKQAASLFEKELLDLEYLKNEYHICFDHLIKENTQLKIILTVSPVRHIKDGIVGNSRSKAVLMLLSQYLAETFADHVIYYPSYEILMDDLRDYRFYDKDLIHPNEVAVDYIYDHFQSSFLTDQTKSQIKSVDQYNRLLKHEFLYATEAEKQAHQTKIDELKLRIDLFLK